MQLIKDLIGIVLNTIACIFILIFGIICSVVIGPIDELEYIFKGKQ